MIIHPEIISTLTEDEIEEFRAFLSNNNLRLIGFSTHGGKQHESYIKRLGGVLVTKNEVRKNKGSPLWVKYVENEFNLVHNKLVYIGYGKKKFDWLTAINSSVFYIHYGKSIHKGIRDYVLRTKSLATLLNFIELFFYEPPLFTYTRNFSEQVGLRILFDAGVELEDHKDNRFKLQDLFTYSKSYKLGKHNKYDARSILFLTLIAQLWKEGIASRGSIWCVYPSSKKGKVSKNMEPYIKYFKGLTGSFYKQILERKSNTIDKSLARASGNNELIKFENEFKTLEVKEEVRGRNVIVVDDFSTTGMSLEVAKLLLEKEGAKKITLCAVGKYSKPHDVYDLDGNIILSLFLPKDEDSQKKLKKMLVSFNKLF